MGRLNLLGGQINLLGGQMPTQLTCYLPPWQPLLSTSVQINVGLNGDDMWSVYISWINWQLLGLEPATVCLPH